MRSRRLNEPARAHSAKLSVSLSAEHEAWIRARARREGRAFSAVLGDAVEDARQLEARRELMRWLAAGQSRPITAADLEDVAREWRAARRTRSSRKTA